MGRVGVVNPMGSAVRIHTGDDVEGTPVDQLGQFVDDAVALGQVPDRVQADFGALQLVAVDVAVYVHRRLVTV